MLSNSKISHSYNLSTWLIPFVFFISVAFICFRYVVFKMKEVNLEEEIISIVNHSFRTPITSIMWHTSELEKNLPQNEKFQYLQNINNGANKILGVVDILVGIKDIKDISGYFFQAVSMREIVEKSMSKYRDSINKKGINFQVSIFNNIPLLTVDLKKISFVVDTLIENAILYTKKDGKILIDCISNQSKLVLFISDTGIGLGMIDKWKIFSKFYRNKRAQLMNPDGMGLRLYLSKEIIKRHSGKIYAKSNGYDEGSTFFIELPFNKK